MHNLYYPRLTGEGRYLWTRWWIPAFPTELVVGLKAPGTAACAWVGQTSRCKTRTDIHPSSEKRPTSRANRIGNRSSIYTSRQLLLSHITIYKRKRKLGKGPARNRCGEIEEVTSPTRTRQHKDGYGKSPAGGRFQKGQSGNPCSPRGKNLPALSVATLNAPTLATTDRCRRDSDQAAGDGRQQQK